MKILFCGRCFSFHSFKEKIWTFCDCKQMAARWLDPNKGTVQVLAQVISRTFIIGMNNRFLMDSVAESAMMDTQWREAHKAATDAPGYLFDESRRGCWACVVRIGQTVDIDWHPDQTRIDRGLMTTQELVIELIQRGDG